MLNINRGSHFLLTEAIKKTALQNRLTEAVNVQMIGSVNTPILRGSLVTKVRLS